LGGGDEIQTPNTTYQKIIGDLPYDTGRR